MGSQSIGNGQQQAIPLETIQSLLSQYGQQLLCLEADLNEKVRGGLIKPSVFRRRLNQLKEVQLKLRVLQRHCSTEVRARTSGDKGELPLISSPTPLEETVCDQFFARSAEFVAALEKEASRVQRWLLEAVAGKPFALRHVLRLSKLRRMIGQVDKRTASVQDLTKGLNLQIEKLLHETGAVQPKSLMKSSVDGLVALFQAVERLVTRVAQLKTQIKETQVKASEMDLWIKQAEEHARTAESPLDTPTPLAITQFVQDFQDADAAIERARAKRELAEAFWKEVVTREQTTLEPTTRSYDAQKRPQSRDQTTAAQSPKFHDLSKQGASGVEVSTP